jgi:guanylate kinase
MLCKTQALAAVIAIPLLCPKRAIIKDHVTQRCKNLGGFDTHCLIDANFSQNTLTATANIWCNREKLPGWAHHDGMDDASQMSSPRDGKRETGRIFVLIGPSGVGKTTLAEKAQSDGVADRVVTCTTRAPRPHETPGRDYYFLSLDEFEQRERKGDFVENEWIHGNRYGVLVRELSQAVESGRTAVISLGYGGARHVKTLWPEQVTIVGVLPPSSESLRIRLQGRGTEDNEMALRLQAIEDEAQRVRALADVIVVNDEFTAAYQQLYRWLSHKPSPNAMPEQ